MLPLYSSKWAESDPGLPSIQIFYLMLPPLYSSKWEPDPSVPFQPPEHLRDIIDKFETDEAPSIGLPSRPVAGSSAPQSSSGPPLPPAEMKAASTTTILEEHKDNIEFIRS